MGARADRWRARARDLARRARICALRGTGLLAVALGAAAIGLGTSQGEVVVSEGARRLVNRILAPGWTIDRPSIDWDLHGRLRIEGVVFRDPGGAPFLSVGRLDARLDLSGWRERRLTLVDPRLDGVDVSLDSDGEGVLDIVRAFGGPRPAVEGAAPWGGLPFELVVRGLSLRDGAYRMRRRGDDPKTTLDVAAISATGDVRLPLHEPRVEVTGAHVQGHLLVPGPAPLAVDGDVTWTGDGVEIHHTRVDLLDAHLVVDGALTDLWGDGQTDLRVDAAPLDLPSLDALAHANLHGRYGGAIEAHGPLYGLALTAELRELDAPAGAAPGLVALREGTWLCLPREHAAPAPCGDAGTLAWRAVLDMEHVQLERILPVVRGPLRLEGRVAAAGHGTRWPDGVFVDEARWEGAELDAYGLRVRDLAGDITLRDGTLFLDNLGLTGVAGTVTGGGSIDLVAGKVDLDLRGPLDLDLLADLGVDVVHGRGRYTGHVLVDWKQPGVPVDVQGELWVDDLRYTDGVRVDRAHATYRASVLRGITDVDADVDAAGVHPWGADADVVRVPDLHVRVDEQIRVTGTAAAPGLRYGTIVHVADLSAPFTFDRPRRGGIPHVTAQATTGTTLLRDLPSDHGAIGVELTGDQLTLDVDLRAGADPFLVLPELRVDLSTLTLRAGEVVFAPTHQQTWHNDRELALRVVDGGLADADVALSSHLGAIALTGDVATGRALDGALVLTHLDLAAIANLAPDVASDYAGVVDASVRLSGDPHHPRLVLDGLHVEDLMIPDVARWMDIDGSAETRPPRPGASHDTLSLDVAAGVNGDPLLRLSGDLPVRADLSAPGLTDVGQVDLDLTLLASPFDRLELLMPDRSFPDGSIGGALRVTGAARDPDLDLRAVTEVDVPRLARPARIEIDLARRLGELTTHLDVYDGLHPVARGDGTARTRLSEVMTWLLTGGAAPDLSDPALFADDLDIDLHLLGVDVATLQAVAGTSFDARGLLTGRISADGSPAAPDLRADLDLDGAAGGEPVVARLSLGPGDDRLDGCPATNDERPYQLRLRLDGEREDREPWINVCGAMPLHIRTTEATATWSQGTMDLKVGGVGLPLRLLGALDAGIAFDDASGAASGRRRRGAGAVAPQAAPALTIAGSVGGTFTDVRPDLTFSTAGGRLVYRPMGLALRELGLSGSLTAGEPGQLLLSVDELGAETAPAAVSFQGLPLAVPSRVSGRASVTLDHGRPSATSGQLELSQAWILGTDDAQLRATGTLDVTGAWPALVVRGGDRGLVVDQGFFSFDANNLLEARDLHLDRSIVVHRGETSGSDARQEEPSLLDDLDIQFRLDLGLNTSTHIVMPVLDDLGAVGAQVTRADVEARVGGQLDVHLDRGVPDIGGELLLRNGEFALLRAQFAIDDESRVTFLGADYANPRLDIHGVMAVTGGTVEVDVGGTAGEPEVDFSSEEFGEDGALFTVFTGQPPEDFSSQQARAAVEALSDLLLNSVLGGLNLGSVSVEADGTVTMGVPLYRTIYVQSLFKPAPKLNEDRVTVIAEWNILPKLLLTAAYGDRHIWGNLFWEIRF